MTRALLWRASLRYCTKRDGKLLQPGPGSFLRTTRRVAAPDVLCFLRRLQITDTRAAISNTAMNPSSPATIPIRIRVPSLGVMDSVRYKEKKAKKVFLK